MDKRNEAHKTNIDYLDNIIYSLLILANKKRVALSVLTFILIILLGINTRLISPKSAADEIALKTRVAQLIDLINQNPGIAQTDLNELIIKDIFLHEYTNQNINHFALMYIDKKTLQERIVNFPKTPIPFDFLDDETSSILVEWVEIGFKPQTVKIFNKTDGSYEDYDISYSINASTAGGVDNQMLTIVATAKSINHNYSFSTGIVFDSMYTSPSYITINDNGEVINFSNNLNLLSELNNFRKSNQVITAYKEAKYFLGTIPEWAKAIMDEVMTIPSNEATPEPLDF